MSIDHRTIETKSEMQRTSFGSLSSEPAVQSDSDRNILFRDCDDDDNDILFLVLSSSYSPGDSKMQEEDDDFNQTLFVDSSLTNLDDSKTIPEPPSSFDDLAPIFKPYSPKNPFPAISSLASECLPPSLPGLAPSPLTSVAATAKLVSAASSSMTLNSSSTSSAPGSQGSSTAAISVPKSRSSSESAVDDEGLIILRIILNRLLDKGNTALEQMRIMRNFLKKRLGEDQGEKFTTGINCVAKMTGINWQVFETTWQFIEMYIGEEMHPAIQDIKSHLGLINSLRDLTCSTIMPILHWIKAKNSDDQDIQNYCDKFYTTKPSRKKCVRQGNCRLCYLLVDLFLNKPQYLKEFKIKFSGAIKGGLSSTSQIASVLGMEKAVVNTHISQDVEGSQSSSSKPTKHPIDSPAEAESGLAAKKRRTH